MPILNITNNGLTQSGIQDPETLFFEKLPVGLSTFDITNETLKNLEEQLTELSERVDDNGAPLFVIDVASDGEDAGAEFKGTNDLVRYLANKVMLNTVVSDPSSAPTVALRRVDIAAGEAMVDGKLFIYSSSTDDVGDAELDVDGVDVSGVDLATDEDVWTSFVYVNDGGSQELVLVRGAGVDNTGSLDAANVTDDQIAKAVGVHLGLPNPFYNFVRIADVLYEESTGLTDTTFSRRPAPPSFS